MSKLEDDLSDSHVQNEKGGAGQGEDKPGWVETVDSQKEV